MYRNEIISTLYESKEIAQALRKMQPASLREELKQEMFMALCNISDEKFWSIYNNNGIPGLKFWLVRTMLNMIYSTGLNTPFFRHFRQKNEEFNVNHEIVNFDSLNEEIQERKEMLFSKIEEGRKQLSWYENTLLETYMDLGFNQKELSRKTKIPYQSVIKTISIIKKKLREE
jgi:hypothetical protein